MKTLSIIKSLVKRGIYLLRDGDKIKCRAPKGAITDAARDEIKSNKGEILMLLENGNPYNLPVVAPNYNLASRIFRQLLKIIQMVLAFFNASISKVVPAKRRPSQRSGRNLPTHGAMTTLINGDCNQVLDQIPANSVDAMVTDPPYGLKFMSKDWDKALTPVATWKKCLRVLKPGSMACVFCAARQDVLSRTIINLEEAGFKVPFSPLFWTYATGFPKAHNIRNALQKKGYPLESKELEGAYAGFQPKPAVEVIIVAMKPIEEKTYTAQALINGKALTWLDDCRIPYGDEVPTIGNRHKHGCGDGYGFKPQWEAKGGVKWSPEKEWKQDIERQAHEKGRFPANLLVSDNVLDDGKEHISQYMNCVAKNETGVCYGEFAPYRAFNPGDTGGYSRFFSLDAWAEKNLPFLIVPKASNKEKNAGLEKVEPTVTTDGRKKPVDNPFQRGKTKRHNNHPTVKPIELMAYLIAMGSRPGGTVIDPFMGTGTTCIAASMLGRRSIGIEKDPEYFDIASARVRDAHLKKFRKEAPQQDSGRSKFKKKSEAKAQSNKASGKKNGGFREHSDRLINSVESNNVQKNYNVRKKSESIKVVNADFYPWCNDNLSPDSVDLILTDPPYPKKYLHLWDQLGEVAANVLKPGGYLVTYSGLYYLPTVIEALDRHLTYCWMIALHHKGKTQLVFASNVICTYKPILIFRKGEQRKFKKTIPDSITSDKRDKKFHIWGQGEKAVRQLMDTFTEPNDLVLDPFVGGGTTLAVAKSLGRKCIGIEIDPEYFEIASARVRAAHLKNYYNETVQNESGSDKFKGQSKAKAQSSKSDTEKKSGFRDWTEPNNNVNICTGCENDCLYCYAKSMAYRFKQVKQGHWHEVKIRQHDVDKNRKLHNGLVGFPSSHDIMPSNIDAYLNVLEKLLHAGNDVLIVSKPRIDCIKQICNASQEFKDKLLFRFTIGAMDDEILKFWEPKAPKYQERKDCLAYAFQEGFRTSVSMEPMLDTANIDSLIKDLEPFVTENIWLGMMNHLGRIRKNADKRLLDEIELIESGQTSKILVAMYDAFKDNQKIKWKTEALKVINKSKENKFKGWNKALMTIDSGVKKEVAAPVIISATRRSDIPAWHSKWFMDGLRNGHIKYQLRGTWHYVSFDNTRCIVFWTKNPKPMIEYLDEIDQMEIGYYFTHTLNNYENEGLEPGLPALQDRIDTFRELSQKIGKKKVIWRFDPLILADKISKELLIERIGLLMERLDGYTEKIVFSFLSPEKYNAKNKLKKVGIAAEPFSDDDKKYIAQHIAKMAAEHNMQAATCSEAMKLSSYGIIPNKCIDDELIRKIFRKDTDLMKFIGLKGLEHNVQGENCGCIQSYDVGIENTCKNSCVYCYANASQKAVESNLKRLSKDGEV